MEASASLRDCFQSWKEENQNSLNPLTFRRYTGLVEKHLLPCFGDAPAQDISGGEIRAFLEEKEREGMAQTSRNMLLMLLRRLLQAAGADTAALGLEPALKVPAARHAVEIMDREGQQKLDGILRESPDGTLLCVSLAYKMGLALGEICGLEWQDVDFANGLVSVSRSVQRLQGGEEPAGAGEGHPHPGSGKTHLERVPVSGAARRELPVPEAVLQAMEACRKAEGPVLACREGRLPDPRREQIRLEKFLRRQELEPGSFQNLRDTFAVRCIRAGMGLEDLSYVLGHASVSVTAQRYRDFLGRGQERAAALRSILERA